MIFASAPVKAENRYEPETDKREDKELSKKGPDITQDCVVNVFENKYLNVVDLQYDAGRHYFDATRHAPQDIVAIKSDEEFKTMLPDAVTCFVIIKTPGSEARLLFVKEFRYPIGRFVIAPPAGLMDPEDKDAKEPLFETAIREIHEETGIEVKKTDKLTVVNPLVFSSPGMTDESNALVSAVITLDDLAPLSNDNAEITECFDGFLLLTRDDALSLLKEGRDNEDRFYSAYTWMALMYFVSGMWE